MKIIFRKPGALFLILLGLFAVSQTHAGEKKQDFKMIMHGAVKYAKNCASCHGKLAQGAPNWHEPDAKGNYPPPPLDGTGHTWHHSKEVLTTVIKKGGKPMGGVMPAFEKKLSDKDIDSIIAWLQSHWPEKILKTWKNNFGK